MSDVQHKSALLPLKVDGLHLTLGGQSLLCGIDLMIAARGVTVIMGPNGAGKSLLLRCLHGLLVPDVGQIQWNGMAMSGRVRRCQAMVFQRPVLLRRSVLANVRFAQKAHQLVDEESALAFLEDMRLADIADRPARKLSGGEQQRLALARALATRPDILFLDEPTASLDPASTRIIEDTVGFVSQRGTKVILVTHDLNQARRLADDITFLAGGKVCEQQSAEAFFSAPQSPQADDYLMGRLPEI